MLCNPYCCFSTAMFSIVPWNRQNISSVAANNLINHKSGDETRHGFGNENARGGGGIERAGHLGRRGSGRGRSRRGSWRRRGEGDGDGAGRASRNLSASPAAPSPPPGCRSPSGLGATARSNTASIPSLPHNAARLASRRALSRSDRPPPPARSARQVFVRGRAIYGRRVAVRTVATRRIETDPHVATKRLWLWAVTTTALVAVGRENG